MDRTSIMPAPGPLSLHAPVAGPMSASFPGSGADLLSPTELQSGANASTVPSWNPSAPSYVINPGVPDPRQTRLVWQNIGTGERSIWLMNRTAWDGSYRVLPTVQTAWSIAGVGNFNSYGYMDLVWQNTSTGERSIWFMIGDTWSGAYSSLPVVPIAWSIAGVGDFDHDGDGDLVWQNTTTGERAIWLMNGIDYSGSYAMLPTVPVQWSIAAVGDFNGDGNPDLVWQNTTTGDRSIWFMNGTAFGPFNAPSLGSYAALETVPVQWSIAGADDFNEDGQTDIVWQNTSTGDRSIWLMNGATHTGSVALMTVVPTTWRIAGAADLTGRPCSTRAVGAPPNAHPGVSPSLAFGSLDLTDCTMPDGSFADRYTFTLPFPTEVQIDQRSNTLDSYLGIANSAGTFVATDDDGGGGVNGRDSRIHTVLPAGSYTLWANGFSQHATGPYSLTLASACQLAIPVTPPALGETIPAFAGSLASSDCRGSPYGTGFFTDRYLLSVAVPTEVQIQMTSTAFSPWITLMGSDGTNITAGGSPRQSVLAPGNYLISAEGFNTTSTGAYGISVLGPCQYSTTLAVPAIGATATTASGAIANSDCRFTDGTFADAYTFTLTAVSTVTIDLKSPDATIDAFMYLYYTNSKIIAFDDDGGAVGFDSQIVRTLAPGTYTIWANTFGTGDVGNYTVSLFHNS